MASSLNHPNILTIFEIGEVDSSRFIATEYIDGETLRQRISRSSVDLNELLEIAVQVASALVAAHKAKIIHRDIKPENIMLRHDDRFVKVLDFGLAKLAEKPSDTFPATEAPTLVNRAPGVVLGTVAYMSPEQAIFSSWRSGSGNSTLWRVQSSGGAPQPLAMSGGGQGLVLPTVSRKGNRVAYFR